MNKYLHLPEKVSKILEQLDSLYSPKSLEGHSSWEPGKDTEVYKQVISRIEPSNILEIGVCAGHSTLAWLYFSKANLISLDSCKHEFTKSCMKILEKEYPDRFEFHPVDTKKTTKALSKIKVKNRFDLLFVDGDHNPGGVRGDSEIGFRLEIPYILYDDYRPGRSDGVEQVVDQFIYDGKLEQIGLYYTGWVDGRHMILCENKTIHFEWQCPRCGSYNSGSHCPCRFDPIEEL